MRQVSGSFAGPVECYRYEEQAASLLERPCTYDWVGSGQIEGMAKAYRFPITFVPLPLPT